MRGRQGMMFMEPAPPVAALDRTATYHFIGIGGYGMSGLATVLLASGVRVTGSDAKESSRLERLRALGAQVHVGHRADLVDGAGVVVYSTDIPDHNPELAAARERGITLWHRSQLLARLLNGSRGVAVTGTHGKTTTTAMAGQVLMAGGLDPTVLVGGEVPQLGGTARLGSTPWVVAEACESDGSFLRYQPYISVITNVEPEHLEHYGGDFSRLKAAVREFAGNTLPEGWLVLCSDDPLLRELAREQGIRAVTYGRDPGADLSYTDARQEEGALRFTVLAGGVPLGEAALAVPGEHNIVNALAAMAVARLAGMPFAAAARALGEYRGVHRRFQIIGRKNGMTVVDDYAHHPTEIRATLRAARQWNRGRVIAVFQPHRYSRTHLLMEEFGVSFGDADVVILTEIYAPPGVEPIPGVSADALARRIEAHTGRSVHLLSDAGAIVEHLAAAMEPGDLVVTMGAGDIWQVAHTLARRLGMVEPQPPGPYL